jgi:TetR/AcrR family transcriptional repressor of mexJK operon
MPRTAKPLEERVRGRLDEDRLAELLGIAAEVFITKGFEAASTNEIAKRSNSSKGTFYSRFPTKEDLFLAVIEHRMQTVLHAVTSSLPQGLPMKEALRQFGQSFIQVALSKEQIALVRLIGMEAERFPTLGQRFFEIGPKRGQAALTDYMRQHIARGTLRPEDPVRMSEHYMSLLAGGDIRWYVLGFRPAPLRRDKQAQHLEAALNAFLSAYGTERDVRIDLPSPRTTADRHS